MELKLSSKQEKNYINKDDFNKIKMLSKQMKDLLKRGENKQAIRICEEFEKENSKINIYEDEYIVSQLMSAYNRQAKKEKLNKNILCLKAIEIGNNLKGRAGSVASQKIVALNELERYEEIIEETENWKDKDGKITDEFIESQRLVALNELERYEEIIEETENWKDKDGKITDEYIESQRLVALNRQGKYEEVIKETENWGDKEGKITVESIESQRLVALNGQGKYEEVEKETENWRNEEGKITSTTVASQLLVALNGQGKYGEVEKEVENWRDAKGKITNEFIESQLLVALKGYRKYEKVEKKAENWKDEKGKITKESIESQLLVTLNKKGKYENVKEIIYRIRAKILENEVTQEDIERLESKKEQIGEYEYGIILIEIEMRNGRKENAEKIVKKMIKEESRNEKEIKELKKVREEIKKKKSIFNIGMYDDILGIDVEKGREYIEKMKKEEIEQKQEEIRIEEENDKRKEEKENVSKERGAGIKRKNNRQDIIVDNSEKVKKVKKEAKQKEKRMILEGNLKGQEKIKKKQKELKENKMKRIRKLEEIKETIEIKVVIHNIKKYIERKNKGQVEQEKKVNEIIEENKEEKEKNKRVENEIKDQKQSNKEIQEQAKEMLKKVILDKYKEISKYIEISNSKEKSKNKEIINRIDQMEEILERKKVGGKQILQIVSYLIAEGRKQEIEKIYPEETEMIEQLTRITNCKIVINKQELREKISVVKEKYKDDEQMQETIEKLIENAKKIRKEQIEETVKYNNKRKVKEIRKNKIQEKTITKINIER